MIGRILAGLCLGAWGLLAGGGAAAQAAGAVTDINAELEKVDCSSLQLVAVGGGRRVIQGTVPTDAAKAQVAAIADRLAEADRPALALDILKPPLCALLHDLDQMRKVGLVFDDGIEAKLPGAGTALGAGTPLQVSVTARTNYPMELRIDYFMLDGSVLHMWPNPDLPDALIKPGDTRVFNKRDARGAAFEVAPPFGTEFITVTATPKPLDLGAVQPLVESGDTYVQALKAAIAKLVIPPEQSNEFVALIIHTAPQ